ncbi:MAG TPA: PfkB family carbohydrate kinase [Vicinamibacterales bacterium]|nr:PfkB family carbohydrate kinase [Vicinamibacterales bacterium]
MRRLLELIDAFPARRVAVIGDLIADEFIYGRVERLSREAPVLILQYDSTEVLPGGAGNAANNVAALGARARIIALAGRDEPGKRLQAGLRNVDTGGILRPSGYCTPVKTRILAGGVHTAKQQIVRIDRVVSTEYDAKTRAAFARAALKAAAECDAILMSDYGTGLVTPELARALIKKVAARSRRRPVPILIDSRYDLMTYRGLTACTPNESEVEQSLGLKIGDNVKTLERVGRQLLKRTRMRSVLITRGSRGMALFEVGRPTIHVPIHGSDEVADVTGAGDTVIATMTLAIAAGGSFHEAARLANYAGGIVVMKRGTATVSPDELRAAVRSDNPQSPEPKAQSPKSRAQSPRT